MRESAQHEVSLESSRPIGEAPIRAVPAATAAAAVCAACGGTDVEAIYSQRDVPAHSCLMLPTREEALAFPRGDIDLGFCRGCGFIGNTRFDPRLSRYSQAYEETQAYSPRFVRFLNELCDEQIRRFALGPGTTALEIGCGKGEYLVALCERSGCRGIGLDPGYHPERTRTDVAARLTFIRDFYGPAYAHLQADYICCRHTLEHIPDVAAFLRLIRGTIGDRRGVSVFFELPDMERVLHQGAFWDIYYEHCSYFTRGSLARLFRACAFDVRRLYKAYDEQYLMLEAVPAAGPTDALLPLENDLATLESLVARFRRQMSQRLQELAGAAARWRAAGKRAAIWGSGSKCVSLLSAVGFGEELAAVVDINPHKRGKFLAGSGIEIESPQSLARTRPDVVVVMNAIYAREIAHQLDQLGIRPELVAL
jgi:SAM-dependent methyltransferase